MKLGNNKPKSLTSIVTFGKHKGKTIQEIINEDVGWLFWAVDESIIELDNVAYSILQGLDRPSNEDDEYSIEFRTAHDF